MQLYYNPFSVICQAFFAYTKYMDDKSKIRQKPSNTNGLNLVLRNWWHLIKGYNDIAIQRQVINISKITSSLWNLLTKNKMGMQSIKELQCMEIKWQSSKHSFAFDGLENFFITVNSILKSVIRTRFRLMIMVCNDMSRYYLNWFALATMKALSENGTSVIHIIIW